MFTKKRTFFLVILVLVIALAIAGCSKATDPVPQPGNGEQEEPVGDGSLQRVLDAGIFAVAGSGGYPPFNFFDDSGDNVIGFDVDTGEALATRLGVELDYITTAWDGIIEGVRTGRYDAVLGSMAITEERLQVVNFTIPYYYSGAQLVVREDSGIIGPGEMSGKVIGVVTGTTFADDAEAMGAEVKLYEDDNQTLMELINGRIDGVITDRLVAIRGMQEIGGGNELTLAGELLRLEEMGLAINKNDEELLAELNQALEAMHADGTLTRISEEWFDGMDITVK